MGAGQKLPPVKVFPWSSAHNGCRAKAPPPLSKCSPGVVHIMGAGQKLPPCPSVALEYCIRAGKRLPLYLYTGSENVWAERCATVRVC